MASKGGRLKKKIAGHPPDCQCSPCCFKRKSDAEFAKKAGNKRRTAVAGMKAGAALLKTKVKLKRHKKSVFAPGATPQPAKPTHSSTPLQSAGAAGMTATAATHAGGQKPLRWRKEMPRIVSGCKNINEP
jgi:hypothetical protein